MAEWQEVVYDLLNSTISKTLNPDFNSTLLFDVEYVSPKISVAYFSSLWEKSRGDLMKDDIVDELEWPLKVISGTVNGFNVSQKYSIQCTKSIRMVRQSMCEQLFLLPHLIRKTNVRYDVPCDLLGIAKFLVWIRCDLYSEQHSTTFLSSLWSTCN